MAVAGVLKVAPLDSPPTAGGFDKCNRGFLQDFVRTFSEA